jgi:Rps23 Pro-64 3,4-dihydroxylase Tpa1-like proline 4-hydroxylase
MIEDFKILKLEDIVGPEVREMFKFFTTNLKIDKSKWSTEKEYLVSPGEPTDLFKKFCKENNKEELFKSFEETEEIDYKLWKGISDNIGWNIQNNALKAKYIHDSSVQKLLISTLYELGWSPKEEVAQPTTFSGHMNVYPKGGNMKKHRDGSNRHRFFTILIFLNSGRKKEDGAVFNIWDRHDKKYSILPDINNVVIINHRTSYDTLHEVTTNNVDNPRYSLYNVVDNQLILDYDKNKNMPSVNFVFEELGKPNGKPETTTNGIVYNLGETSLFYQKKNFDVNNIPDENYIYLIEPFGGITNILYRDHFINYINSQVLTDIREKKCTLVIGTPSEGNLKTKDINQLYRIIKGNNLPSSQITFIQSNYNLEKQFDDFLQSSSKFSNKINLLVTEHKLETSKESFIEMNQGDWNSSEMKRPPTLNTLEEVEKIRNEIRPYRFVSYNKSLRPDRVALLSLLYKEGIFDEGMISMGSERGGSAGSRQSWPTNFDFLTDTPLRKEVEEWSEKLEPLRPMSIEGDVNVDDIDSGENEGANPCGYTYGEQYRKVYFQVVTEDVFEAKSMFFSQTTYKPIVSLTPFIMFGSPYMMKNLHEVQGFDKFTFIDESYDSEEDNNIRLQMIVAEIKRLCEMPIKDLHDCYYSELKVLKGNQERIFEESPSMDDYKLSRYLLSI